MITLKWKRNTAGHCKALTHTSAGETSSASFDTFSNITQYTKQTHSYISSALVGQSIFQAMDQAESRDAAADQAEQHIWASSAPIQSIAVWWWSWLGRLAGALWGQNPWRRSRSSTDDPWRQLERQEHKGMLKQQEVCIPLMPWIHGTEKLWGDQVKKKSGEKNIVHYWKIRNEVQ